MSSHIVLQQRIEAGRAAGDVVVDAIGNARTIAIQIVALGRHLDIAIVGIIVSNESAIAMETSVRKPASPCSSVQPVPRSPRGWRKCRGAIL